MSAGGSRSRGEVEEALGYGFAEPGLLDLALAHPSFAHDQDGSRGNERLEFLGDAVLDLVVSQLLFETHPDWTEGQLSRARASLVNAQTLADHARALRLGNYVRLGKTERHSGGAEKDSILGNLFEALLGALYLDGGLEPVTGFLRRRFGEAIAQGSGVLERDPKTQLQEWAHARGLGSPRYATVADTGLNGDEARFAVEVRVADAVLARGIGRSKRRAEMVAAEEALRTRAMDA